MKTLLLVLTLVLSSTAFAVQEGRDTSEALLTDCIQAEKELNGVKPENAVGAVHAHRCAYYLDGFRDSISFAKGPQLICIPQEVTSGQLLRVVLKYLRENPSKLHLDKAIGVHAALQGAYPCR
jgi:hypothetical protein